jgi:hypothetical protein
VVGVGVGAVAANEAKVRVLGVVVPLQEVVVGEQRALKTLMPMMTAAAGEEEELRA